MRQDIYEQFGIAQQQSEIDANGTCMAAIQGLYDRVKEQQQVIEQQESLLATQSEALQSLRVRVNHPRL